MIDMCQHVDDGVADAEKLDLVRHVSKFRQ